MNGYLVQKVLEVANQIGNESIDIGVVDIFKIKPISKKFYKEILNKSEQIFSVEEGSIIGGLGTSISEIITNSGYNCNLKIIGAPDKQLIEYGDREWFHKKYGLDVNGIKSTTISYLNQH